MTEPTPDDRADEVRSADPGLGVPAPLDLLKALGDNTRYAIYLELARASSPRSTAEVADVLGLHVNTVRPHLERMREVGLVEVEAEARGGVGRPQHRWALAPDAPSLGLEPPAWPLLAATLLDAAVASGLGGADLLDAGIGQGRRRAARVGGDGASTTLDALTAEQSRLGFDPEVVIDGTGATVAFAHCPFRALAEAQPELICSLHCGLVHGFVDGADDAEVARFHPLADREPCRVDLVCT